MEPEIFPWLFAVLTGGWFGWMASRAGRSWALWAVGGAAFGLVASTIVIGLGRAGSIPYSAQQASLDRLKWLAAAFLLMGAVGWMLTAGLHRHHKRAQQQALSDAAAASQEPKASVTPPTPKKSPPGPAT
jgi:hypothetical protein